MFIKALRIGIEIEVLLCAKSIQDQRKSSTQDFAHSLVDHYNSKVCETTDQPMMLYALDLSHASDDPTNFAYWSLTEDSSIDLTEDRYRHLNASSLPPCEELLAPSLYRANIYIYTQVGFEFASPILRYEFTSRWRPSLRWHFQTIQNYADIMSDASCGMHIHVSPGGSEWTLDQVRNVSRSILYFEEAFEALLPLERRGNRQCRSNRIDNPKLRCLPDLDACCQAIQECTTIKALTHLMNANANEDYGLSILDEVVGVNMETDRRYAFNFENLLEGKIGTIGKDAQLGIAFIDCSSSKAEFRRPPCVTNYEDCVMWVEFGASFILAAMQCGISLDHLRSYQPDVAGLEAFIGMTVLAGVNDEGILARMFARASGSLPVLSVDNAPSIHGLLP